jgi:hypothetical protein
MFTSMDLGWQNPTGLYLLPSLVDAHTHATMKSVRFYRVFFIYVGTMCVWLSFVILHGQSFFISRQGGRESPTLY